LAEVGRQLRDGRQHFGLDQLAGGGDFAFDQPTVHVVCHLRKSRRVCSERWICIEALANSAGYVGCFTDRLEGHRTYCVVDRGKRDNQGRSIGGGVSGCGFDVAQHLHVSRDPLRLVGLREQRRATNSQEHKECQQEVLEGSSPPGMSPK